ncbi:MAG: hypothetical protein HY912_03455 [Desulfomonile tiedjei]|uniref:Uncharacterized protein n=1 Tax=Desulfomonile tiedjei TaxID=2358 RepID=A0A9D6V1Z1_9BACT|nr:hypothetical protein [Desulfomonile tiedjei]
MLRRIPSTPLVCLFILLSTIFITAAWAASPDESLEILLKPNQVGGTPVPAAQKVSARPAKMRNDSSQGRVTFVPPGGITKVKPACVPYPVAGMPMCILPTTRQGQWEISGQVLFARAKGSIQWPRLDQNMWGGWWGGYWAYARDVDLNDDLQLPAHKEFLEFSIKYQFRPTWAIRYSVLGNQLTGAGWPQWNSPFVFGYQLYSTGQPISSKWQHAYHRATLEYNAVKTCSSSLSVFAGWVHTEDKIEVNCWLCGYYGNTFSKSMDAAIAGLELQRCLRTAANGATFSLDCKAGGIFLDDSQGYDVQAGARYSIPLNTGRWGYAKGGYRVVSLQKTQNEWLFKNQLEGGFLELGFIF